VPSINALANGKGSDDLASRILPVISAVCPFKLKNENHGRIIKKVFANESLCSINLNL
jgi:hypothetical protein